MSKARRTRERKAPTEASDKTVVYLPGMGSIKVGELKAKLTEEAKVKPTRPSLVAELEKAIVTKVVEKGGRVTRTELGEILGKVKEEKGVKRGLTLSKLIQDGFVVRIKVPKTRAFYAVTEEGAKKAGVIREGKP